MNDPSITGADSDWPAVVEALIRDGWARLAGIVDGRTCARLVGAAPSTWSVLDMEQGRVRQAGLSCGVFFDDAFPVVQQLGVEICDSINAALPSELAHVPLFNEVEWSRSRDGVSFITPHRDPPGAGGVIAIVTLWGQAPFRIWPGNADPRTATATETPQPTEWLTADGDLVIMRGNGWPSESFQCPVHEAQSPVVGDRMIMTLRYNKLGPGQDYFA